MSVSIEELKETLGKKPRIKLVNLPTPLEEMPRLTKILNGPRLWIKRDDCTGLALGGNKERKTEFVMADALTKKADVVITTGPVQSNHVRATAAAARKLGLKVVLLLHGAKPETPDGNLLLDHLLGAEIHHINEEDLDARESTMEEMAENLRRIKHVPYIIPGGASYPVGGLSYVNAMLELLAQAQDRSMNIKCVVHAAGSGGTQAGLVLANKAVKAGIRINGICVEPNADWMVQKVVEIADGAAELLNIETRVEPGDVSLIQEYAGEYGKLTPEISDTIRLVAQTEGILLDPVYTGKAMTGLIDMVGRGEFKKEDNVVFIHTGGLPALFAYLKGLT